MISDEDRAKLRFDLAIKNLQSVGRAQAIYVTTLLIYICLTWMMLFSNNKTFSFHLGWLDLQPDDVWKVTPVVTLVLTLALIGTLNAALIAYKEVKSAGSDVFGATFDSMFQVDNHKNLID